jgi:hypothetical protein
MTIVSISYPYVTDPRAQKETTSAATAEVVSALMSG